jgi:hypothetical protein
VNLKFHKSHRALQKPQGSEHVSVCQQSEDDEGLIHYGLFAVSIKWVSVCPLVGSTDGLMLLLHQLLLWPTHIFRAVAAVNYQTVCNVFYLVSVKTTKYFYRRHNTANVTTSQLVTRLLTVNSNFGGFYVIEFLDL